MADVEGVADAGAQGDDERPDLLAAEHLVQARLLDVEHLAEHGQDRLEAAVAALLGRATGRVALDDVQLAPLRVALLAVGELARQGGALEGALADDQVARLARCLAGTLGGHRLLDDPSAVARVLVEVLGEALRDGCLDLALDLGVAQLGLGLALELGIGHLDADDRGQALADIVARQVVLGVLDDPLAARPVVEAARQGRAEARDVGAAVDRVDIVSKGKDCLGIAVVVLDGDLDGGRAVATLDGDGPVAEGLAVLVEVAHEAGDATLEVEGLLLDRVDPLVHEADVDALGQVRRLAHALGDGVEVEVDGLEDLGVGHEHGGRAVAAMRRADEPDRGDRLAAVVLLAPDLAVAGGLDA